MTGTEASGHGSRFTLEDAHAVAREVHGRQTDKLGAPYLLHVEAVAAGLVDFDVDLQIAGLLHDVVEDSPDEPCGPVTIEDLRARGVTERSLAAIAAVSSNLYPPGLTYADKIALICRSPDAVLVKLADNAHNSLPGRVAALASQGVVMGTKYADARTALVAAAEPEDVERIWRRVNPGLLGAAPST